MASGERSFRSAIICLFTIGLAALAVSCSSTPSRYRGSLSDAMDKSKDDYEGGYDASDSIGTVTGEGFDNDYFDYFDSITLIAEMAVKL